MAFPGCQAAESKEKTSKHTQATSATSAHPLCHRLMSSRHPSLPHPFSPGIHRCKGPWSALTHRHTYDVQVCHCHDQVPGHVMSCCCFCMYIYIYLCVIVFWSISVLSETAQTCDTLANMSLQTCVAACISLLPSWNHRNTNETLSMFPWVINSLTGPYTFNYLKGSVLRGRTSCKNAWSQLRRRACITSCHSWSEQCIGRPFLRVDCRLVKTKHIIWICGWKIFPSQGCKHTTWCIVPFSYQYQCSVCGVVHPWTLSPQQPKKSSAWVHTRVHTCDNCLMIVGEFHLNMMSWYIVIIIVLEASPKCFHQNTTWRTGTSHRVVSRPFIQSVMSVAFDTNPSGSLQWSLHQVIIGWWLNLKFASCGAKYGDLSAPLLQMVPSFPMHNRAQLGERCLAGRIRHPPNTKRRKRRAPSSTPLFANSLHTTRSSPCLAWHSVHPICDQNSSAAASQQQTSLSSYRVASRKGQSKLCIVSTPHLNYNLNYIIRTNKFCGWWGSLVTWFLHVSAHGFLWELNSSRGKSAIFPTNDGRASLSPPAKAARALTATSVNLVQRDSLLHEMHMRWKFGTENTSWIVALPILRDPPLLVSWIVHDPHARILLGDQ